MSCCVDDTENLANVNRVVCPCLTPTQTQCLTQCQTPCLTWCRPRGCIPSGFLDMPRDSGIITPCHARGIVPYECLTPLLDGGYTRVPNQYLSIRFLRTLTKIESLLLAWVIRATCGWNRAMAPYHPTEVARELGTDRGSLWRASNSLEKKKVIVIDRPPGVPGRYGMRVGLCQPAPLLDAGVRQRHAGAGQRHAGADQRHAGARQRKTPVDVGVHQPQYKRQNINTGGGKTGAHLKVTANLGNGHDTDTTQAPPSIKTEPDRPMTQSDVAHALRVFAVVFNRPHTEARVLPYWTALRGYNWSLVKFQAICVLALQRCKFFPTPSELCDLVTEARAAVPLPPRSARGTPASGTAARKTDEDRIPPDEAKAIFADIWKQLGAAPAEPQFQRPKAKCQTN
jgi:hypothetical protein